MWPVPSWAFPGKRRALAPTLGQQGSWGTQQGGFSVFGPVPCYRGNRGPGRPGDLTGVHEDFPGQDLSQATAGGWA